MNYLHPIRCTRNIVRASGRGGLYIRRLAHNPKSTANTSRFSPWTTILYTCALLCSRVSVGHHGCPAPEAVTTAATGAAEPAGDRERAPAGDLTRCRTARWASWPACIGRSCTSAPGTCCGSGSVQGGCPRGAQDPRRHLGHWGEAHGWRHRGSTDHLFCPIPGDYFGKLRKLCV